MQKETQPNGERVKCSQERKDKASKRASKQVKVQEKEKGRNKK